MKYAVVTFGCRVNQADSLAIEGDLLSRGCRTAPAHDADLVIVNTCSVTASADQAARQAIRRIARANPAVRLIVTGCYATRRPDEVAMLPNVVRVVKNASKDSLAEALPDDLSPSTAVRFGDGDGPCGSALHPGVGGRTALTIRVQTGCEERCAYCIIPRTRGSSRSRPVADVLGAVRRAVAAGYREIAITGVHLGSYGRDLPNDATLTTLVRSLGAIDEDVLFRISSLEPMDCAPEIIDMVAASPRLAPHFHLPLQHGSDAMLRAMRRPYSARYYRELVERIKTAMPHAAVGSDIIVGFPGETPAHVAEMRALLEEIPLTYLHVFPYSDRPGTDASLLSPKVDGLEIRARAREIRSIGELMAWRFARSQIGRAIRALTVDEGWTAVTPHYLKLRLDARCARNEWIDVVVGEDRHGRVLRPSVAQAGRAGVSRS